MIYTNMIDVFFSKTKFTKENSLLKQLLLSNVLIEHLTI